MKRNSRELTKERRWPIMLANLDFACAAYLRDRYAHSALVGAIRYALMATSKPESMTKKSMKLADETAAEPGTDHRRWNMLVREENFHDMDAIMALYGLKTRSVAVRFAIRRTAYAEGFSEKA